MTMLTSQRRIFIRDMRLPVSIGIYDFELAKPQAVVINVELLLADPDRAHGDSITNVLNYETVPSSSLHLAKLFTSQVGS